MGEIYDPSIYNTREWYESLAWQHRWIEFCVGWWVGAFGKPRQVGDFGAGDGWWCHTFRQIGSEYAYAIELHELAREFIPDSTIFVQHDLTEPLEAQGAFDLSICVEVAEHLPEKAALNALVPALSEYTADLLIFSAAQPGQQGTGHVNLQSLVYWIDKIERWGKLKYSEERTAAAKVAFERILPGAFEFLPRNLLIFARV